MQSDGMYFTRGYYKEFLRYDLRKWVLQNQFDKDTQKYNTLIFPTKAGQSMTPHQLTRLFELLDQIAAAIEEAKNGFKSFEARFHLGDHLYCTVSGAPYFKIQLRRWYIPKKLLEERKMLLDVNNYQKDLRPSQDGAVFGLYCFNVFRQIVSDAIAQFGVQKCECEEPSICSFCSPYTCEIQQLKNQNQAE